MSTIKISELPVITGANVTGSDVIPIVDVSLGTTNQITRDEFFKNISGNVGIGAANPTDRSLSVSKPITGGTTAYGIMNNGTIQTDVTTAHIYRSSPSVIASHPTVTTLVHYHAAQGTIGAGSVVTSQVGFSVNANMIGATTNVGFSWNGIIAASVTTGKTVYGLLSQQDTASGGGSAYNIYSSGTAPNYFAGNVGIGTTNLTDRSLSVSKSITGGTTAYGIINNGAIQTDVTTAQIYRSGPTIVASHPTVTTLTHYQAVQGTIGAGSAITTQIGFGVDGSMIGAASNYCFFVSGISAASVTAGKTFYGLFSNQASASGGGSAWNIYSNGTAPNYFAGSVGVGATAPIVPLHVVGATVTTGVVYKAQPIQTSKAAAATLTIADLLTGIIQYTGASATLTLPLGTAIEGGLPATFPVDMSFDVSFINTGSGTLTIGTAAGLTLVGAMTTLSSALLRFRKTAANAYTVYRIS